MQSVAGSTCQTSRGPASTTACNQLEGAPLREIAAVHLVAVWFRLCWAHQIPNCAACVQEALLLWRQEFRFQTANSGGGARYEGRQVACCCTHAGTSIKLWYGTVLYSPRGRLYALVLLYADCLIDSVETMCCACRLRFIARICVYYWGK